MAIVGPTASGKTRLAASLARRFQGEVVNADSRQVYRHMDIGTAKPTLEERLLAPHHLIDLLDPDQDFSLGAFLSQARLVIQDIFDRGRLPIVSGGTGQYVWALLEGWQVPEVPADPAFRAVKEREAAAKGAEALYRELESADPARAAQLDPRNVRRVIRALEVHHLTGGASQGYNRGGGYSDYLVIGLTMPRQELYRRIDERVDWMMAQGLEEECRRLADMGYRLGTGPLSSPGYREMGQHLEGQISLAEAVQRTKFQTHRLARRQYTWFKLADPRIRWLDATAPDMEKQAEWLVEGYLDRPSE